MRDSIYTILLSSSLLIFFTVVSVGMVTIFTVYGAIALCRFLIKKGHLQFAAHFCDKTH